MEARLLRKTIQKYMILGVYLHFSLRGSSSEPELLKSDASKGKHSKGPGSGKLHEHLGSVFLQKFNVLQNWNNSKIGDHI